MFKIVSLVPRPYIGQLATVGKTQIYRAEPFNFNRALRMDTVIGIARLLHGDLQRALSNSSLTLDRFSLE